MLGKIYIVATPIGNLQDISLRALNVLKTVDFILAEDTRITRKLCQFYSISTKLISFHQHSSLNKYKQILDLILKGKNLALVTDAGTPCISDPGSKLVDFLYQQKDSIRVIPIPGPSAVISALSISGFNSSQFVFLGFPPQKKGRSKFFQNLSSYSLTKVFYESNHRLLKTLEQLKYYLSDNHEICLCRELTKKFETVYRGKISEILKQNIKNKGEFVIIVK